MFLPEMLAWLSRSGWLLLLHLSARSSFPKPLPPDEEQALLARMQAGDADAANTLIEHNLRLVAHIARKYAQPGVDQDDLVSLGTLGLIKAVHTFRPEAGRLTAYASRCIENEMLMFFRANRKNRNVILVGDSVGQDSEGNDIQLDDLLGTEPDLVPDAAETAIEANRAMRLMDEVLQPREQEVLRLRYGLEDGDPWPQHRVAARLGISRSYVSRIEKKGLEKLRAAMEGEHG
ncbi:MAG: sigma-70 family RNA polymerase sigma factor [Clostridia bacterium]|nr:sigma-70 family RNA polymerase sigma factor [Clostridia bacterium]